eukprot:2051669-Amphidinium_carterae.1
MQPALRKVAQSLSFKVAYKEADPCGAPQLRATNTHSSLTGQEGTSCESSPQRKQDFLAFLGCSNKASDIQT